MANANPDARALLIAKRLQVRRTVYVVAVLTLGCAVNVVLYSVQEEVVWTKALVAVGTLAATAWAGAQIYLRLSWVCPSCGRPLTDLDPFARPHDPYRCPSCETKLQ